MTIDFSLSPELEAIRLRVREFIDEVVRPTEAEIDEEDRDSLIAGIVKMRGEAIQRGRLADRITVAAQRIGPELIHANPQDVRAPGRSVSWGGNCAPDAHPSSHDRRRQPVEEATKGGPLRARGELGGDVREGVEVGACRRRGLEWCSEVDLLYNVEGAAYGAFHVGTVE